MKRSVGGYRLALLLLLLSLSACKVAEPGGVPAPALKPGVKAELAPGLPLLGGGNYHPQSTPAKWRYVNYWAVWCEPCIREIPEFNRFAADYGDQVDVLGVNFDGVAAEELQRQADRLNIAFAVPLRDPGRDWGLPLPRGLPVTYVMDAQGQIRYTLLGAQTYQSLTAALRQVTAAEFTQ